MESNTPASYKNYLPSKKIRIVIGVLLFVACAYFLGPLIVKQIKKIKNPGDQIAQLNITIPTGDPTVRDTDGDGVLDWQEIAVGLDINSPETKPGVSDYATFQSLRQTIGPGVFEQELGQVTDTDKVSLTIYDALAKESIENGEASVVGATTVTAQELLNYMEAQRSTVTTYTPEQFDVVSNDFANNKKYAEAVRAIARETETTKNAPEKIRGYLDGTVSRSEIEPILKITSGQIQALRAMPVPRATLLNHVEMVNALQGVYQILNDYSGQTTDELKQLSTAALVQDYLIRATKSVGMFSIYISVALDEKGYIE